MRRREPLSPEVERELAALDAALAGERVDEDLADLALLVADVRATAPRMAPQAAARLDERLEQGFPRPARRRVLPARPWILAPAAGLVAAALIALVVVLGGGEDEPVDTFSSAPAVEESASGGGSAGDTALSAPRAAAPDIAPAPPPGIAPQRQDRKVERSALLVLEARDGEVEAVADRVIRTTDRFGGIVASSSIGAGPDTGGGEAVFDLRIPTARLDAALAALSELGHVAQRTQDMTDITGSFASVEERLSDARAERRGLQRALGRATTERQVRSLRARLRAATSRVARLKGDLAALRRRADLSTVSVTVRGGGEAAGEGGGGAWTPGDAAGDAVRVLEVAAGVLLVALAVALPLALLGAPALLAARTARRRRRESALDAA
jgi:hypothetical protein